MHALPLLRLSRDQHTFYHEHGYVLLPQVVSAATLAASQRVLARWVDELAAQWLAAGLITDLQPELPFARRLLVLWHAAGKPTYMRSPRRDLVSPDMYAILRAPELVDIAQDLLGTPEVFAHPIFNARPKLPDQRFTDTPWHQDAQYFREAEHSHVPSFWFPLQDVGPHNSCLQVQPDLHRGVLHAGYDDPDTGFLGLAPEVRKALVGVPIPMARGDLLCFTQMTPHGALPNRGDAVRWSMDLRYQDLAQALPKDRELGFIARSAATPASETTCADWLQQWANRPRGGY